MALWLLRGSLVLPLVLIPLLSSRLFVCALEMIDKVPPDLTCGQGLIDCDVSEDTQFAVLLPNPPDTVNVTHMQLKVMLCCSAAQDCKPCLQINITVQVAGMESSKGVSEESFEPTDEEELSSPVADGSGQIGSPEPEALVIVGLSYPYSIDIWRSLQFNLSPSSLVQTSRQLTHKNVVYGQLLWTEEVSFGVPVVVQAYTHSEEMHHVQNVTIPSLEEVCSMNLLHKAVKECDAPRLQAETDHKRNVIVLQLENTNTAQNDLMCQVIRSGVPGEVLHWPKGEREMTVSSKFVAPCLCFRVWWKGKKTRSDFCPFQNQQDALERMQQSVSLSMEEFQLREGGTRLSLNVTAPCPLEAEVWLCRKDVTGGHCEEVTGSRQRLFGPAGWSATHGGHWKMGEFNMSSHPLLCVQIKIHGMESYLEPHCLFATSRWRWSLPILIGLLLMCVAMLGAYLVQGVLKGYMWRWLKEDDVKGAVGGGHVVLLYPPDDDQALPEVMCHLGSSLQALGFSVSLDLWSQAELSLLGPVPWLHSRLDQLKRQGGKVVLVLTRATWVKAEEWGARSWERRTSMEKSRDGEKEEAGRSDAASSRCVDVFSASLSCILADYLQGRAGERFMLVQFESLPPEPPGGFRTLPELFRGLHVYSLPSQSLGFLTELAGARQTATASARRKRAGGLRVASRALARGLSGFTAGTTVLRLAGVPQSCVGVRLEDSGETVPLQPCLITPPSSPDTSPKVNDTEWI